MTSRKVLITHKEKALKGVIKKKGVIRKQELLENNNLIAKINFH